MRAIIFPYGLDDFGAQLTREEYNAIAQKAGEHAGAFTIAELTLIVRELQRMVGAFASTIPSSHEYRLATLEVLTGITTPTGVTAPGTEATQSALASLTTEVTSLSSQILAVQTQISLLPQHYEWGGEPEGSPYVIAPNGSTFVDTLHKIRYTRSEGKWIQLGS